MKVTFPNFYFLQFLNFLQFVISLSICHILDDGFSVIVGW